MWFHYCFFIRPVSIVGGTAASHLTEYVVGCVCVSDTETKGNFSGKPLQMYLNSSCKRCPLAHASTI